MKTTKEQIIEKLDFRDGDKAYIIIVREENGRTCTNRINVGMNVYELIGLLEHACYEVKEIATEHLEIKRDIDYAK